MWNSVYTSNCAVCLVLVLRCRQQRRPVDARGIDYPPLPAKRRSCRRHSQPPSETERVCVCEIAQWRRLGWRVVLTAAKYCNKTGSRQQQLCASGHRAGVSRWWASRSHRTRGCHQQAVSHVLLLAWKSPEATAHSVQLHKTQWHAVVKFCCARNSSTFCAVRSGDHSAAKNQLRCR